MLAKWNKFHDWYLDRLTLGPNEEPRELILGLYRGNERVDVTFEGVTCFNLEHLGLLNIVYGIKIIEEVDKNYEVVIASLNKGERLSMRKGATVAFMYSSLGAELAIEFDSLRIESV
ncbi:hypothetical protein [Paraburkholderia rhizosphaerae]|uniref:Immunity protein 50 of polymorphic toxin system n=1 Tax=Paraburkholderia rhizosphaerae TaxID=480658 RepID=A0A4R8KNX1_9BURK|nr:hypothetical protein [Paraburkholderia rhizosphaerae]TDY31213.1 hypothetical protein BX592_1625 [Paraburkholderia rhizosphaerae]